MVRSSPVTEPRRLVCVLGFLLLLGVPGAGWGWQIQNQPCLAGPAKAVMAYDMSLSVYWADELPKEEEEKRRRRREERLRARAWRRARAPGIAASARR